MVKDEAGIVQCLEPQECWCVTVVEEEFDHAFEVSPTTFSKVAVLVVWITGSMIDPHGTKDLLHSFADLRLRVITDE